MQYIFNSALLNALKFNYKTHYNLFFQNCDFIPSRSAETKSLIFNVSESSILKWKKLFSYLHLQLLPPQMVNL